MIEDLTPERLREIGFNDETIKRLANKKDFKDYEAIHYNGVEFFSASSKESKIYSGIEARRKIYFRDEERPIFPEDCLALYEEYLSLKRENYLKLSKETAGPLFQRDDVLKAFHTKEVALLKNLILKRDSEIVKSFQIVTVQPPKGMGPLEICLARLNRMTTDEIAPATDIQSGEPVSKIKPVELSPEETKLKEDFKESGFLGLPKLACLTEKSLNELIRLIFIGDKHYKIAMTEYLEINKFLRVKMKVGVGHFLLSGILKIIQREVTGQISSFVTETDIKSRYRACLELVNVKNDYDKLALKE